jgi:hypothetical protein
VLHELGDQGVGLFDRPPGCIDKARLDVGPAGPEPLGLPGSHQWTGRGRGAPGAVVGGGLRGGFVDRRGRQLLVRPPILDHGGAVRPLIGGEVLPTELVVREVAPLDVGRCRAVGRCGIGGLLAGQVGGAQVFTALVHR